MAVNSQEIGKQAQRLISQISESFNTYFPALLNKLSPGRAQQRKSGQDSLADALSADDGRSDPASQIKKLKAACARLLKESSEARTRLQQIEKMLTNEKTRPGAILYYQLSALWDFCHQQLVLNQKQLIREFEGKEKGKLLEGYKEQQEKESQAINKRFERLEKERKVLESEKKDLIQQINANKQIWQFLKKRELTNSLKAIKDELGPIEEELNRTKNDQNNLIHSQVPSLKGMSMPTRRAINNHLIAYAQLYYVWFSTAGLSKLARSAKKKSV